METSYYSQRELEGLGLKSFGHNVFISRYARFYGASRMSVGDNVRIDDFCVFCGDITIGSHIHIAPFCALYGEYGILLADYSGLSARVTIYSAIDDFSGEWAVGPMVDESIRCLKKGKVSIEKYVQIGVGSVVFPDLTIGENTSIGAMSLVNKSLEKNGIFAGIPVRKIRDRKNRNIQLINSMVS